MADDRIQYERGGIGTDQLKAELATFFASAAEDDGVTDDAEEAGVDLDALLAAGPGQIEVEPLDPQFTGVETAILVMLLTPPAQSAWDEVILPWLKRRHASPFGKREKADGKKPDDEG